MFQCKNPTCCWNNWCVCSVRHIVCSGKPLHDRLDKQLYLHAICVKLAQQYDLINSIMFAFLLACMLVSRNKKYLHIIPFIYIPLSEHWHQYKWLNSAVPLGPLHNLYIFVTYFYFTKIKRIWLTSTIHLFNLEYPSLWYVWLVGYLVGWLTGYVADWLAGRFVGFSWRLRVSFYLHMWVAIQWLQVLTLASATLAHCWRKSLYFYRFAWQWSCMVFLRA